MSYSLKGRLDSRLAATLAPLLFACVLARVLASWWPLQLAAVMLGLGLLLDVLVYDRLIDYQPGWAALPLGLLELVLVMSVAPALRVHAPPLPALAFFAISWALAQVLGHAALPLWRLTYGEDGGELGQGAFAVAVVPLLLLGSAAGTAMSMQPPTVRLAAGIHQGPIILESAQRLVGERGAVVRGGIVIRADDVVVRGVRVIGGENGIEVDGARRVRLEHVTISGAELDGIHVRRSAVEISDCSVDMTGSEYGQGIDISYGGDLAMSSVQGCSVRGGQEGIVTHFSNAMLRGNRVAGTTMRAISMTEMSMGEIEFNSVGAATGVGILCGDHSECEVRYNRVTDIRPEPASTDPARRGVAILSQYGSHLRMGRNSMAASPGGVAALLGAHIRRE